MIDLNDEQRAAVDVAGARICLDAGPGTGKTRVLAARAARYLAGGVRPQDIVMITYTRAMAGDLRARVAASMPATLTCSACGGAGGVGEYECGACAATGAMGVGFMNVSTIHAFAARLVREALAGELPGGDDVRASRWLARDDFEFVDDSDKSDYLKLTARIVGKRATNRELLEGLKLIGPAVDKKTPAAELRLQLASRGLITYDDVMTLAEIVLRAGGVGRRYPILMVDERQDLTPLHWRLIKLWAPAQLFAVGDDGQAIFGFLFGRDGQVEEPEWDVRLALHRNYRSGAGIVDVLNATRNALAADGACSRLLQTPAFGKASHVDLDRYQNLNDETDGAVLWRAYERVVDLVDAGRPLEDIAVVAATNGDIQRVAHELQAVGIDCDLQQDGVWVRSALGRAVTALARLARGGGDPRLSISRIYRARGLEEAGVDAIYQRAFAECVPVVEVLDRIVGPQGWWVQAQAAKTMADVADVVALLPGGERARGLIREWMAEDRAAATPGDWIEWAVAPTTAPGRGVAMRTIHGAKGLEWPVVVIVNASEGAIPPPWAREDADKLEWGRALYVALSRAKEAVYVIAPEFLGGRQVPPCRWLRMQ